MKSITKMLDEAVVISHMKEDDRHFRVGSIAVRGDGAIVRSCNGAPKFPTPAHHSEGRLCRKLDRGATVFVARTTKDGIWAMSKPCKDCERALRRAHVKRVYYTIGPSEYGCVIF
jgi:deoxycytidylate deaminase